ncbi:hypothetical protein [Micromonospora sp. WMMD1155]|nr:hypothetical protein [Micromonospora sp. WMMD1155]WFE52986.1 hypothetical protein O7617_22895 [Micromonospora sp. WMMD1155]
MIRGTGRDVTPVDPEKVAEHARFRLIPDWARFSENRIQIQRDPSEDGDE